MKLLEAFSDRLDALSPGSAAPMDLHRALGGAVMAQIAQDWKNRTAWEPGKKRVAFLSGEFLIGRAVYNNLLALGALDQVREYFQRHGRDFGAMEDVAEPPLGVSSSGRFAACLLDSAATLALPVDGYGMRYRYGYFRQGLDGGMQTESADDWFADADPWSVRRENEMVEVAFNGHRVRAIPFDMPIIGYGVPGKKAGIGRLRLWQAEPADEFSYVNYRRDGMGAAFSQSVSAAGINALLFPDDSQRAGKVLRLKQQYFFCSATIQDLCRGFERLYGSDFARFPQALAIHINGEQPAIAIPELIRVLTHQYACTFDQAFDIAVRTFSYCNRTVDPQLLEKWNTALFRTVLPDIFDVVRLIDKKVWLELTGEDIPRREQSAYRMLSGSSVHMARIAVYGSAHTAALSKTHEDALKNKTFAEWHQRDPGRIVRIQGGVTQRRWLALCNPALSDMITELLGGDAWITDLARLKSLDKYADDAGVMTRFRQIKQRNKQALAAWLKSKKSVAIDPARLLNVEIKAVSARNRLLLTALVLLDLYYAVKDGEDVRMPPGTFLFSGKAAPGDEKAGGVIKLISEIAARINAEPAVSRTMQLFFVPDYNVTLAQRIIPAAEIALQPAAANAGYYSSGAIKLALNGAVTAGALNGANAAIFGAAGKGNNYPFGRPGNERNRKTAAPADPYARDPRIKRAVDSLINGAFDDGGTGIFRILHQELVQGSDAAPPDPNGVIADFASCREAMLQAARDSEGHHGFSRRGFMNMLGCASFSMDATVRAYAEKLWGL
ncbi:MAG: glycogen/starch/alpha-glucan family phosphorylase [Oscillospiraceae bacterium]|jgi:starch phosphorylase|nr:glycogen/starch/alpha-glucan family phosphorylase [Oscillospiraceae bacterium]